MLETFKYINHMGEEINFGSGGVFANESDLRDFEWGYNSYNNRITSLHRGIVSKTIPITIKCKTEEEGIDIKNRIYEVFEKDNVMLKHGRLVVNDYYMQCFITGSAKAAYLTEKQCIQLSLKISTDFPSWIKETKYMFLPKSRRPDETTGSLDFENDFPYDYTSELFNMKVVNPGFISSNFKMIIYGGCINPEINIGGHKYQVNCDLSEKEYVTIDSTKKTVTYTRYNGEVMNIFNDRNKESYIFEKIPSGDNMVSWNNDFGFDIILYEERSEPKWI